MIREKVFSVKAGLFFCHFFKCTQGRKRAFHSHQHGENIQLYQERSGRPGRSFMKHEVRTSIQVFHLYLRALSEGACQSASECGRQADRKMLSVFLTGILRSLQGLRPLRRFAAILS